MKKLNILEDSVNKLFLRYLIPSISATLVTSIYILADTLMIGRGVGAIGIGALNILLPLFSLYFATGLLFGTGGGVLMSISKGRKDEKGAEEYFTISFLLATLFSVFYVTSGQLFFDPFTKFLGRNEAMDSMVREYGRILIFGAPLFLFSAFFQTFLRNDKAPKLAMIGVIAGGVFNIILDYILIFPLGMGMAGAATATLLGTSLTLLILLTHLFSKDNSLKFVPITAWNKAKEVFVNGFSSFLLEVCNGIVTFLFNRQLLTYVGDIGVVVYGIISNSALIVSSVNSGVAQTVQPLVAMNFGANKKERIKQIRHLGERTVCLLGILFVGIGLCFPSLVTKAFVNPTEEILSMSIPAIRIYFLSFAVMGFNILYSTWFQSTMKSGYAMAICLLRGIILSSILVFVMPLYFGVIGIWSVMPVAEAFTFVVCRILMNKSEKSRTQIAYTNNNRISEID
ncbi:MATE family efflux transporter [Clostridium sp. E02]|uniref:MATE family efflux transporter n=1 Tax=Clostridium sp. E02 TaxID=2487134 RepID=UPI000F523FBB|nr:MATE family efflux transporter [Clostridium sp. E02]